MRETREVTFKVVEPIIEPEVAVIKVVPYPVPVAAPLFPAVLLTVATDGMDEPQITDEVRFCWLPFDSRPLATSCCMAP